MSTYNIRPMTRSEVDIAVEWAAAEGWNPGLHDADCFYRADPSGFWLGLVDDEPVATLSAVKYGESFGFIGFYIVKPEYRGQGYGLRIWHAGLSSLGQRTIGLDGVVEQQDNYRKSGFTLAYRNSRYQVGGGGTAPADPAIVPLSSLPFDQVAEYDRPFFPDPRPAFLRGWIAQPQSTALGWRRRGELGGYGVIRPCRVGYKVGPLFADSPDIADRLFSALRASVPSEAPVFLDSPTVNPAAGELVARYAMSVAFETARMYIGPAPAVPVDRVFGVTTFELG